MNRRHVVALACTVLLAGAARADDVVSRAQLDAWLAEHPRSAFDALTPGARERFLASLEFGPGGIEYLDASDLMDELTDAQIRAVFAVFGPRALEMAPPSHAAETRRFEKYVRNPDVIGPIERSYNDYYAALLAMDRRATDLDRAAALARAFDARLASLFDAKTLRAADDHELRLLRAAARKVAFGTLEPRHVDAFRAVFAERRHRWHLSSDDVAALRNLLLASHRLAEARVVARDFPVAELPPLPVFVDTLPRDVTAPTVWIPSADERKLTRQVVDPGATQVIVLVSARDSRELVRAILAEPRLGSAFARSARWLVAAPGLESTADARQWNREFPDAPVAMVYARAEWTLLADWNVPRYYVVRDGKAEPLAAADPPALADALQRRGLIP